MAVRIPTAGPGDLCGSPVDDPEDEWLDLSDDELAERRTLCEQMRVDDELDARLLHEDIG